MQGHLFAYHVDTVGGFNAVNILNLKRVLCLVV